MALDYLLSGPADGNAIRLQLTTKILECFKKKKEELTQKKKNHSTAGRQRRLGALVNPTLYNFVVSRKRFSHCASPLISGMFKIEVIRV
jgi:hypothetical protein